MRNSTLNSATEGSIFWWYGIMTFGRYLGAWRRWGWAWNSLPPNTETLPWSASFVESVVIFTYGFTQQFMERFGKQPGDPYSAKDIEHISIAVMFWAGGLVGMAIETPKVRRWLLGGRGPRDSRRHKKRSSGPVGFDPDQNAGSTASNPLPAVVVGITGIAMSAHQQEFQFQVQIHALWGYLLLGFAICRCLTCFLEWVRPERRMSMLPGLPPTELIGSIFLGAGGIAFICSDEEITLWAMRTHRGAHHSRWRSHQYSQRSSRRYDVPQPLHRINVRCLCLVYVCVDPRREDQIEKPTCVKILVHWMKEIYFCDDLE
jgi:hypothetical protein